MFVQQTLLPHQGKINLQSNPHFSDQTQQHKQAQENNHNTYQLENDQKTALNKNANANENENETSTAQDDSNNSNNNSSSNNNLNINSHQDDREEIKVDKDFKQKDSNNNLVAVLMQLLNAQMHQQDQINRLLQSAQNILRADSQENKLQIEDLAKINSGLQENQQEQLNSLVLLIQNNHSQNSELFTQPIQNLELSVEKSFHEVGGPDVIGIQNQSSVNKADVSNERKQAFENINFDFENLNYAFPEISKNQAVNSKLLNSTLNKTESNLVTQILSNQFERQNCQYGTNNNQDQQFVNEQMSPPLFMQQDTTKSGITEAVVQLARDPYRSSIGYDSGTVRKIRQQNIRKSWTESDEFKRKSSDLKLKGGGVRKQKVATPKSRRFSQSEETTAIDSPSFSGTTSQSLLGIPGPKGKTSNYKGVSKYQRTGKWESHIWDEGKQLHLGTFMSAEEAARAYDLAAILFRGQNAKTNFPKEEYQGHELITNNPYTSKQDFIHMLRQVYKTHCSLSSPSQISTATPGNHGEGWAPSPTTQFSNVHENQIAKSYDFCKQQIQFGHNFQQQNECIVGNVLDEKEKEQQFLAQKNEFEFRNVELPKT